MSTNTVSPQPSLHVTYYNCSFSVILGGGAGAWGIIHITHAYPKLFHEYIDLFSNLGEQNYLGSGGKIYYLDNNIQLKYSFQAYRNIVHHLRTIYIDLPYKR